MDRRESPFSEARLPSYVAFLVTLLARWIGTRLIGGKSGSVAATLFGALKGKNPT